MTFGWDYPPGCSGNEYEINGPEREEELEVYCPHCDADVSALVQSYQGEAWWNCPLCDEEHWWEDE